VKGEEGRSWRVFGRGLFGFRTRMGSKNSRGVALLLVLWVMIVLSVVALEFSFAMRTEIQITKNFQEDLQLYGLAEAGIQRAIAEMVFNQDPRIQQWRRNQKAEEIPEDRKGWVSDGREYKLTFERGESAVRVMGEAGKVNINLVSESMLRRIIDNFGLEEEQRDTVVDSIMDWRDPDDFYRVNGAENDYYQSLPDPYLCKNGNLDSVEELLLVKGVTLPLFQGKKLQEEGAEEEGGERIGLKDLFSIYAPGEQVDINSASLPVLKVVLGIPFALARQIITAREETAFENLQDLIQRVPEISPFLENVQRFVVFRATVPYYTIEARGKSKEGGMVRGIKAIVKIDRREKNFHKIIEWVDVVY
jgi:general secretion pathway protein K